MKRIVLFGAGKSATCLMDYLTRVCTEKSWLLTIGDSDAVSLQKKLVRSRWIQPVQINVENATEREILIKGADLIISLLPPSLHILIARDCVRLSKNLLTASYVDKEIQKLSAQVMEKKLFFLCEMGLDPGIDHMSAMQIINRIRNAGGKINIFRSHTGGLVAPESDNNLWHYKISWNPANIVKAGASGAVYKESGEIKTLTYSEVFENTGLVEVKPLGNYAYYPNRDSLNYMSLYGLETADSFIRTTLRHPDFCHSWKNIVRAGLTDDSVTGADIYSFANWSKPILPFVNDVNIQLYTQIGLFDQSPLPAKNMTSAKILQSLLEKNWRMEETDRDMIVMLHEFGFELDGKNHFLTSRLIVKGENALRTAMAKTVGLPLGIAAKLILENKLSLTGLHIPIIPEIYEPVLKELEQEGVQFVEETI